MPLNKVKEGAYLLKPQKSVNEMEKDLELDKCGTINVSESTLHEDDENYFNDWYKEELKNLYENE